MSSTVTAARAKQYLAKAAPITGWPSLNMGTAFTNDEKAFLKDIFLHLWLGGTYEGYPEAAKLISHYVNGKGAKLEIEAAVYQNSVIVTDTSAAIKDYVRQQVARRINISIVHSSDPGFRISAQAKRVSRGSGRDVQIALPCLTCRMGFIWSTDYRARRKKSSRTLSTVARDA